MSPGKRRKGEKGDSRNLGTSRPSALALMRLRAIEDGVEEEEEEDGDRTR